MKKSILLIFLLYQYVMTKDYDDNPFYIYCCRSIFTGEYELKRCYEEIVDFINGDIVEMGVGNCCVNYNPTCTYKIYYDICYTKYNK